jgi:hypothetical protein
MIAQIRIPPVWSGAREHRQVTAEHHSDFRGIP